MKGNRDIDAVGMGKGARGGGRDGEKRQVKQNQLIQM